MVESLFVHSCRRRSKVGCGWHENLLESLPKDEEGAETSKKTKKTYRIGADKASLLRSHVLQLPSSGF